MTFARAVDNIVIDVIEADDAEALAGMFHADIVGEFMPAPAHVERGWVQQGESFVPPDAVITFYIDGDMRRYLEPGERRTVVTGRFDAKLVRDGDGWRVATAEDEVALSHSMLLGRTKDECRRRIYAAVSSTAQMNMAGAAAAGVLGVEDMEALRAGLQWIDAMRARAVELAGAGDQDFADDGKWPERPAAAAALAERF